MASVGGGMEYDESQGLGMNTEHKWLLHTRNVASLIWDVPQV